MYYYVNTIQILFSNKNISVSMYQANIGFETARDFT